MAKSKPRKPCKGCGGEKEPGGGRRYCSNCVEPKMRELFLDRDRPVEKARVRASSWYEKNPERVKERSRINYAANRERRLEQTRVHHLRTKYGLEPRDYERILEFQSSGCAICGTVKVGGSARRLHVDHSHKTGLVRGLLCWGCNAAIGRLRDNPDLFERTAAYLRLPPATTALGKETYGRKGPTTKRRRKRKKS